MMVMENIYDGKVDKKRGQKVVLVYSNREDEK